MELNKTNSGNRIRIGFFGKVNSGKSSIINEFSDRDISIFFKPRGDNYRSSLQVNGDLRAWGHVF